MAFQKFIQIIMCTIFFFLIDFNKSKLITLFSYQFVTSFFSVLVGSIFFIFIQLIKEENIWNQIKIGFINLFFGLIQFIFSVIVNFFYAIYIFFKTEIWPYIYSKYYYYRFKQYTFYKLPAYTFSKKLKFIFFFILFLFLLIWFFFIFVSFSKNFDIVITDLQHFYQLFYNSFNFSRFLLNLVNNLYENN